MSGHCCGVHPIVGLQQDFVTEQPVIHHAYVFVPARFARYQESPTIERTHSLEGKMEFISPTIGSNGFTPEFID